MDAVPELAQGLIPSGLLIGLLVLVRRGVTRGRVGAGQQLRVRERTGVARGASVAVLEIDGRRFLVGASEHGVRLLSELGAIEPGPVPDHTSTSGPMDEWAVPPPNDEPRSGFVHRLQQMTVRTHVEAPLREHL